MANLVNFTFVPSNNIGKVRSFISDYEVSSLLEKNVTGLNFGRKLIFSAGNFEANEFVGHTIYPYRVSSYNSYKIIENTTSSVTVRGDLDNLIPSAFGVGAIINEAIFTDQEITNFLTQTGNNVMKASALGLKAIASNKAKLAKKFKKEGIGGIELEQRALKDLIALADSFENQDSRAPAGNVVSYEQGYGSRSDNFESNDLDVFGSDLNDYLAQ